MSNYTLTPEVESRFWVKVDKTDSCWLWIAALDFAGYGKFAVVRTNASMAHRVSWQLKNGKIPEGMTLDHICHVHNCVNPEHLRLATPQENAEYKRDSHARNTSGYRGVTLHKPTGQWRAKVQYKRKSIHVGLFDTPEEAGLAAQKKREELYTFEEYKP